jgi:hypothetical protein
MARGHMYITTRQVYIQLSWLNMFFFTTLRSAIDLMCVTSSQQDVQMRPPPSVAFFLVWCLMDNDIYCLPILHSQALSKDQWPSDEEWGSPTAVCEAT